VLYDDLGGHHPRVFKQPANKVLCPPNFGERHQNPLEDSTQKPVRGDQEVHCRSDYQDEVSTGAPATCQFTNRASPLCLSLGSSEPESLEKEKTYLNKLNMILVQILKREWPKNWESFIPDIIGASKTNESLCQNNMIILKLLSEEVFDFSSGQVR